MEEVVVNSDHCGDYGIDKFSTVTVELPNDVIESVEEFAARFVPERNLNGAYTWVLREGLKSLNEKKCN